MKDRVPVNPGRVLITPENGVAPYYATMTRADNPTQEGTPLNKATLLKDTTAELFGLGVDAVPDDALAKLTKAIFLGERMVVAPSGVSADILNTLTTGVGCTQPPIWDEAQNKFVPAGNTIALEGGSASSPSYIGPSLAKTWTWRNNTNTASTFYPYYIEDANPTVWYQAGDTTYQTNPQRCSFTGPGAKYERVSDYFPANVFGNEVRVGAQIATGTYTGTGAYGVDSQNSLTFDFAPKIVIVSGMSMNHNIGRSMNRGLIPNTNFWGNSFLYTEGQEWSLVDANNANNYVYFTVNGNTLFWYNSNAASSQLNTSNTRYQYIAIG